MNALIVFKDEYVQLNFGVYKTSCDYNDKDALAALLEQAKEHANFVGSNYNTTYELRVFGLDEDGQRDPENLLFTEVFQ